jgi:hypothetical protein
LTLEQFLAMTEEQRLPAVRVIVDGLI